MTCVVVHETPGPSETSGFWLFFQQLLLTSPAYVLKCSAALFKLESIRFVATRADV